MRILTVKLAVQLLMLIAFNAGVSGCADHSSLDERHYRVSVLIDFNTISFGMLSYACDHDGLWPTNFAELVRHRYITYAEAFAPMGVVPGTLETVDAWTPYRIMVVEGQKLDLRTSPSRQRKSHPLVVHGYRDQTCVLWSDLVIDWIDMPVHELLDQSFSAEKGESRNSKIE